MSTSTQTTTNFEQEYIDVHTTGIGYVNRIRDVSPKKGDAFLACTIAALSGKRNDPDYTYYDVKVAGKDAQHLIRRCVNAVTNQQNVLVGFVIGDAYPEAFTYTKGSKAGQQGLQMKGRLLYVKWIKVDGNTVYPEKSESNTDEDARNTTHTPQSTDISDDISTETVEIVASEEIATPQNTPSEAIPSEGSDCAQSEQF